ncbi:MAG: SET domain-containing protein-lysine N-methyltransferase [Saprospiraceae bacterium]|nr:SET domain-containing protein-lysine N-methyltransferase [Saprospiraceae bacterium]
MQRIQGLYISKIKNKGRAVFSAIDIPAGSLIEVCPILRIPQNEVDIIHETELHDYYFVWGEQDKEAAIALGYGSLYNHSYKPNAEYIFDFENEAIEVVAIKNIPAGKEITFNYHGDPDCKDELWFDKKGKRIKRIKYNPT